MIVLFMSVSANRITPLESSTGVFVSMATTVLAVGRLWRKKKR